LIFDLSSQLCSRHGAAKSSALGLTPASNNSLLTVPASVTVAAGAGAKEINEGDLGISG
jgi:hypothetical protein